MTTTAVPEKPVLRYFAPEILAETTPRLRYGGMDALPVRMTSRDPDDDEKQRPQLSGDQQMLVSLILDAIQELPMFRWAATQMALESAPGDATAASLNNTESSNVQASSVEKKRESKVESDETRMKYQPAPQPKVPPAVEPVRNAKPIVDASTVARYSRCCADAGDRRLDYAKRQTAWEEANSIYADNVENASEVTKRAVKRATLLNIPFERALLEVGGEGSLPLPPSHWDQSPMMEPVRYGKADENELSEEICRKAVKVAVMRGCSFEVALKEISAAA